MTTLTNKIQEIERENMKKMTERFLRWKLPSNFSPDAGISFKKDFNENTDHPMKHEPSGTNLFDYSQASEMIEYITDDSSSTNLIRAVIELAESKKIIPVEIPHHSPHISGYNQALTDLITILTESIALGDNKENPHLLASTTQL